MNYAKITLMVIAFVLLLAAPVRLQRKSDAPLLWYHPDNTTENGKIGELKDLHKVYVTISQGAASNGFVNKLGQQLVQQLRTYLPELTLTNNPETAEFAVYVRLRPSPSPEFASGQRRPYGGTNETNVAQTNDVDFYVVMRGSQRSETIYVPRVIVHKRHIEGEVVNPAPISDLSSFLKDLRKVQGEK